jgi:hypothetical protein
MYKLGDLFEMLWDQERDGKLVLGFIWVKYIF